MVLFIGQRQNPAFPPVTKICYVGIRQTKNSSRISSVKPNADAPEILQGLDSTETKTIDVINCTPGDPVPKGRFQVHLIFPEKFSTEFKLFVYQNYSQFCVSGFVSPDIKKATCVQDKCYKETVKRRSEGKLSEYGVLVPWTNGTCYELDTQGPCADKSTFKVSFDME